MKNEAGASKPEILRNAISAIKSVKDLSLQNEFLAIMSLLSQDKNRFDVDLIRSCINKEELMSSELIQILTKEIYADELKKAAEAAAETASKIASEKESDKSLILFDKVQIDSLSIPDIAKTVGVSVGKVRIYKAKWMLLSGKPIPEIVSVTGLTASKIQTINIERLLNLGISHEEIAKQTSASLKKILKTENDLKDSSPIKPSRMR
jgi:hypothetical protein